ncbi:MAG TPA: hypothetical protein VEX65_03320 [Flavisolibacter sp.]|nr:hypothetical protein [Flavisolibacter sp.]
MRKKFVLFTLACLIFLSSFMSKPGDEKLPKTITRISTLVEGKNVEKTVILLDGNTSREELIQTCNFLAKENVQLTFDKLTIGKSFLGLIGKQRIRIAEGMIKLANGSSQRFKAGGATGFRFIKIQYLTNILPESSQIEMIEIVD